MYPKPETKVLEFEAYKDIFIVTFPQKNYLLVGSRFWLISKEQTIITEIMC